MIVFLVIANFSIQPNDSKYSNETNEVKNNKITKNLFHY